ncbi:hydroxymethylbilane synthase, partial [Pelagibacterales bacterium SAG-MED45]|nr:hydroxymethylbilane synthase [Pelagibacterales bacterium SAG-MED45]
MTDKIRLGTRGSKLALIYAQIARNKILQNTNLNNEDIIIKKIIT